MNKFSAKTYLLRGAALAGVAIMGCVAAGGDAATKKPAASSDAHQVVTGPVAEYWIDTTTSSGMSLGAMGGGGKPSLGSIMNMARGGTSYSMHLALGSDQLPSGGDATADYIPAPALDAGRDLPLYYKAPVAEKETYTPSQSEPQQQSEAPKGKMLIYWGCGEHAPKDQPIVIDFSKLTDPTAARAMMTKMMPAPMQLDVVHPPEPDRWKTYGEWPNEKSKTSLKSDSSLVGAHTIKGNYIPQIDFTLDQTQDFLPAISITNNSHDAAGAVPLTWQPISAAKGFFATAIGSNGEQDTIVMWTSSASRVSAMGAALGEYLTPHDVERLLDAKVILPGDATTCTVPAEVAASGHLMYSLTAFGGETNIAYPPRPTDPHVPWNIQWETKIRYRSMTGGLLGQTMGGAMGSAFTSAPDSGGSSSASSGDNGKKKKSSILGDMLKSKLGSMIPGV